MTWKVWWRSSTFTMVIIRHLASESLHTGSDCYFSSCEAGSAHTAVCSVEMGGHSASTAAYRNGSCLPSPQARAWKATRFAAEFIQQKHVHVNYGSAGARERTLKIIN